MKSGLAPPGSGMIGGFGSETASAVAKRPADDDDARERLGEPGSSGWAGGKLGSIGFRAAAGRASPGSIWFERAADSPAIASVGVASVCKCSTYLLKSGCGTDTGACTGKGGAGANDGFGHSLRRSGAVPR